MSWNMRNAIASGTTLLVNASTTRTSLTPITPLATDNLKAMKPFLAPLRKDAAASLACGLRLCQSEKPSSETPAVTRDLCAMQSDKRVQDIAVLLRLEQERRTLLKTNPKVAGEFFNARNEWVAELPPSLQDHLPDGLLPPSTP